MNHLIHSWEEIENLFSGTLLIGNGASVAVDSKFHYDTLKDEAIKENFLSKDLNRIFELYDNSSDFELILKVLWQSSEVNKILNIEEEATYSSYARVQEALINTVRYIHPSHDEINTHLDSLYQFTRRFEDIICLNYDLILYWVMMYGNQINDGHIFKDCFTHGEFQMDWRKFIRPIHNQEKCTLVFYPHGNLILSRNGFHEFKINSTYGLLDDIFNCWKNAHTPLFISEGTFQRKTQSILTSTYLSTVFREVLTDVADNLVIYGWGMGIQDKHIMNQLSQSYIDKVAVSVYKNDQNYCTRVTRFIRSLNPNAEIYFFDSASSGCWINA